MIAEIFGYVFEAEGAKNVKADIVSVTEATEDLVVVQGKASQADKVTVSTTKEKEKAQKSSTKAVKEEEKAEKDSTKTQKENNKTQKETNKGTEAFATSLGKIGKGAIAALGSLYALKKVFSGIGEIANKGESMLFGAQSANVSVKYLDTLGYALSRYGGNAQEATKALIGLNEQVQSLKFGGGGALQDVAIRYGLNLYDKSGKLATGNDLLENISSRMQSLDTNSQFDMGRMLGLSEPMIKLLASGVDNFRKEMASAGAMSTFDNETAQTYNEFNKNIRELSKNSEKLWNSIVIPLIPVLNDVVKSLKNFLNFFNWIDLSDEQKETLRRNQQPISKDEYSEQKAIERQRENERKKDFNRREEIRKEFTPFLNNSVMPSGFGVTLSALDNSPLNAMTSQSIQTAYNSRNSSIGAPNITIGEIVVNTQATDSNGIANGIKSALQNEIQMLLVENTSELLA